MWNIPKIAFRYRDLTLQLFRRNIAMPIINVFYALRVYGVDILFWSRKNNEVILRYSFPVLMIDSHPPCVLYERLICLCPFFTHAPIIGSLPSGTAAAFLPQKRILYAFVVIKIPSRVIPCPYSAAKGNRARMRARFIASETAR